MYGDRKHPNILYTWNRIEERKGKDDIFYAALFILIMAITVASILLVWAYTLN